MESVIEVSHLKKYFKEVKAVDDISFTVKKGELFGFLGVNGAGKTTTIQMLTTLFPPTAGEVRICGLKLGEDNEKIKQHIGVVAQNNSLDKRLTIQENLLLRGGLYLDSKRQRKENLHRICHILDLTDVLKRPYGKLSGGQKRRAEIGAALMHTPEILFLDEPTTGLDPATRQQVWTVIASLQKDLHMTVFLTTHYMEEAANASHIAILQKGQIKEFGTPFSLKEKFAKDRLRLIPKKEAFPLVLQKISDLKLGYQQKEDSVFIPLDCTLDAISLLEQFRENLQGFEVIQGTMDDVFLNAMKGDNCHE